MTSMLERAMMVESPNASGGPVFLRPDIGAEYAAIRAPVVVVPQACSRPCYCSLTGKRCRHLDCIVLPRHAPSLSGRSRHFPVIHAAAPAFRRLRSRTRQLNHHHRSVSAAIIDLEVAAAGAETGPRSIEIELAGAVVRVMSGVDGGLLTVVLRAVRCSSGAT